MEATSTQLPSTIETYGIRVVRSLINHDRAVFRSTLRRRSITRNYTGKIEYIRDKMLQLLLYEESRLCEVLEFFLIFFNQVNSKFINFNLNVLQYR